MTNKYRADNHDYICLSPEVITEQAHLEAVYDLSLGNTSNVEEAVKRTIKDYRCSLDSNDFRLYETEYINIFISTNSRHRKRETELAKESYSMLRHILKTNDKR